MKKTLKLLLPFVFVCSQAIAQTSYNYYYGNIHSHTSYSDGNPDSASSGITKPIQAFNYVKNSQHIDFYGISDHNHASAGMTAKYFYHQGIADANTANVDGSFVAMYGVEWGVISGGGHVIAYGTDSLMGWDNGIYDIYTPQNNYTTFWKKINQRPNTFAYLCHPNSTDFGNILNNAVNSSADSAIVGLAGRSGPAFSTNTSYSNPSSSDNITEYNMALARGYHLGIGLDHDTHNSIYGRQSKQRLVAIAPSLTRGNIYDAFKKMRFYCSDDWNVQVNFQIQNQPMGSIIKHSGVPTLSVSVIDLDGTETVSAIAVYHGIEGSGIAPTLLTNVTNTPNIVYTHTGATNNSKRYYYIRVTQGDGNKIWTSPIWYNRDDAAVEAIPVANFTQSAPKFCINQSILLSDISTNAPFTWTWTASAGATPVMSNIQNTNFTFPSSGIYTITLQAGNNAGVSSVFTKTIEVLPTLITPTISATSVTLTSTAAASYQWYVNNNAIPSATTQIYVTPYNGVFHVITSDPNFCNSAKSNTISILNVGLNEIEFSNYLKIYPNPNDGIFTIELNDIIESITIVITNALGQNVYEKKWDECMTNCWQQINLSECGNSVYTIKTSVANKTYFQKMVLNK